MNYSELVREKDHTVRLPVQVRVANCPTRLIFFQQRIKIPRRCFPNPPQGGEKHVGELRVREGTASF